MWSLLDRQGEETSRPLDKHVREFVCFDSVHEPWPVHCMLLTAWVDLIKVPMDE